MFCEPLECCVQPSAYIDVIVLVGDEHSRDHLRDLQELVLRRAADALDHLRRVDRDVLLQQVPDAARILQRLVDHDEAVLAELVVPASTVL